MAKLFFFFLSFFLSFFHLIIIIMLYSFFLNLFYSSSPFGNIMYPCENIYIVFAPQPARFSIVKKKEKNKSHEKNDFSHLFLDLTAPLCFSPVLEM